MAFDTTWLVKITIHTSAGLCWPHRILEYVNLLNSLHLFGVYTVNRHSQKFLVVLSDPDKRLEYDLNGNYEIDKYTLRVSIFASCHLIIV